MGETSVELILCLVLAALILALTLYVMWAVMNMAETCWHSFEQCPVRSWAEQLLNQSFSKVGGMPFCPSCGEEIECLVYCESWSYAFITYTAELNGEGFMDYSDMEIHDADVYESWFECPHCHAKLFEDEGDATNFLRGEVEAQLKAMGSVEKED